MNMRERIARVLGEKHFAVRGHGLAFANEYADAVLDALMEPTTKMLEAGVDNLFGAAHDDWSEDAFQIWQAMLTAARSGRSGER